MALCKVHSFQRKTFVLCSEASNSKAAYLHNVIFSIKLNASKFFLHNVLLFLNLVLDLYYIHNLHTYTKYRKKMVKRRYKRGRSLGIFRSITIYFHNWKHHSIGYQPKLSRLLFTSTGINKTTLISLNVALDAS